MSKVPKQPILKSVLIGLTTAFIVNVGAAILDKFGMNTKLSSFIGSFLGLIYNFIMQFKLFVTKLPKNRMTYIVTTYLISDVIILVSNQLMVNFGINHEKYYKVYLPTKLQEYYVNIIRLMVGGFVWVILSYPLRRYWVFA
jgi:putative flippase GtrA